MIDTTLILQSLSKELEPLLKVILEQHGVKPNADIIKSIELVSDDKMINFLVNDYFEYLSNGRRPGGRKIPIQDLIQFIKKNNIAARNGQTINQLAFAIQTSIYKQGIIGRHYLDQVMQTMADYSQNAIADDLSVEVADTITETLTKS